MDVEQFIAKWENCPGHERANYAVFLTELCGVLDVEAPGPAGDYRIDAPVPGGAEAGGTGFIDLYKRGCFILEAKQSKVCDLPSLPGLEDVSTAPSGARYDDLMRRAFRQARRYAQSLSQPPWPPFIIVLDVGRAFELYFDYGGSGRDYRFFPDRLSYRIPLRALASDAAVGDTHKRAVDLLRAIWTDPKSIDPRFQAADVTRKVAMSLAQVSKDLEEGTRLRSKLPSEREKAEEIEEAALFLMRILFCMFAEDVGLLPSDKFSEFLRRAESNSGLFENQLADLWLKMGAPNIQPRFAHAVEDYVKYFNGGLFSETARTFPLSSIEHAEHISLHGELEPHVIHPAHAVAGGEHEVHHVLTVGGLREPVRKGDLRPVARFTQRLERGLDVVLAHEQIEVLCLAHDARVLEQRMRSAHEERDARVAQHVERAAIEGVRIPSRCAEC